MTTLVSFSDLSDAFLLRSMLEARQIPAFIPDENTCQNWGYINAIGGVRVQVPEEFVEEAKLVLAQFKDKSSAAEELNPSDLHERPAGAGEDQTSRDDESVTDPKHLCGGGLVLVLLASGVVCVFLLILECGHIQQGAFLAAQEAYDKGDYDLAIADYSRSIQFGLRSELVYLNRGIAYVQKGDYDRAVTDFNKASPLDPQDGRVYFNRGYAHQQKGDYASAIEDYSQALLLNTQDEQAYLDRGFAYDVQGDYDKAIADDSKAIQLNPQDEYAYCNRGKAHCDKNEEDAALSDFNQAILLDPSDTQALFNRGGVYQDKGKVDSAIADYNQVIQIDPKGIKAADAYTNRALSYESKGEYDKAIEDCHQALSINPNQSYAYSALAWLLATSPQANFRDGTNAIEAATKACDLTDWKNPYAVDTLAAAYAETGDFNSAVKWERKYLEFSNQKAGDIADAQKRLALYLAHRPFHQGK
jgi:tetratricopeptide (TPR) repeat protein